VSRFRVVAIACCLVVTAAAAEARTAKSEGGSCASPEQIRAAQLRQFHDQLQVAALNCRGDDATLRDKWSAYAARFGGTMAENARTLQVLFKSQAGFDRYNTKVTNYESVRVHEIEDYCATRAEMFDQVMTMSPTQLGDFAATTIGQPDHVSPCGQGKTRQAKAEAEAKPKPQKHKEKAEKPAAAPHDAAPAGKGGEAK
jgi:hypothetical protein